MSTAPSRRRLSFLPLSIMGAAFLFSLSGCPGGAELENAENYSFTGAGGTSTGTGGTNTSGGSAGTGTTPGTGLVVADCPTFEATLTKQCATNSCHGNRKYGDLDLRPDSGLVARIKDFAAPNTAIFCPDIAGDCPTPPATCMHLPFVDSSNWENSWIIHKLREQKPGDGCGDQMIGAMGFTAADEACVEAMVKAIAALP